MAVLDELIRSIELWVRATRKHEEMRKIRILTPFFWHLVLAVLNVGGSSNEAPTVEAPKKMYIAPPSATQIQLPDGRHLAYLQQGVPLELARFNLIMPHSFLSSRLAENQR